MRKKIRVSRRIFRRRGKPLKIYFRSLCLVLMASFLLQTAVIRPAAAQICPVCLLCITLPHILTRNRIRNTFNNTRNHIRDEIIRHREDYLVGYFFRQHILAAMQKMTEQLTVSAMMQMQIVGAYFDAKHQLETQRLFQTRVAEAHKDYHTATDICVMGTAARGLGETSMSASLTSTIMAQRSQDRQLSAVNVISSDGIVTDISGRLQVFRQRFCDSNDGSGEMAAICPTSAPPATINKDVDYTRTVYYPLTLDVDLSNTALAGDEPDVFALANNLYAHRIFGPVPEAILKSASNQDEILDLRSIVAKRSVAEHSFYSIVGLKAAGSTVSASRRPYVSVILQQLGIPAAEADAIIGAQPSYHAQMEMLTKKIYQNPNFYVNLYDKPANLLRKGAAIRAIGLMQDMDKFKSQIRNEAMLAVLVELEIADAQETVQNELHQLQGEAE